MPLHDVVDLTAVVFSEDELLYDPGAEELVSGAAALGRRDGTQR
jgi:hypothetical protein